MNAMLLTVALVLGGGAETLSAVKVGGLLLRAPSSWALTDEGDSKTWEDPGHDAKLELSVFKVDPRRPAQECLDQLTAKLGSDPWDKLKAGGEPAVRKVTVDYLGGPDAGHTDANKVSTVTWVGCNGATKWVLTMSSGSSKSARFGAILKAVVDSIAYGK